MSCHKIKVVFKMCLNPPFISTPRIFLATPTLDSDVKTTNQNIGKA